MKKKIVLLIALLLLIPSIALASTPIPPVPCPPSDSSNNNRPVTIGGPGEKALQDILDGVFGTGTVNAINDQRIPGMWSFSYSAISEKSITVTLSATYAGNRGTNIFGIWSYNGNGETREVEIFWGWNDYPDTPNIVTTLRWNSSGKLVISSDSSHVNTGTFDGISPCSFGFFLRTSANGTFYTLDSLNTSCEAHALAYNTLPNTNTWAIAFEDLPLAPSTLDYNDLVVVVDNLNLVQPDTDGDGVCDVFDNCPNTPNGPLLGTCLDIGKSTCSSNSNCASGVLCSKNQEDSSNGGLGDGLGDACSGGPSSNTKYTLDVPARPVPMSNINLTTTFYNDTHQDIVTLRPDCVGNTTFTVTDSEGNSVLPIDRIRTAYRIAPVTQGGDVITIPAEKSYTLPCNLADIFPPEAQILVPGDYTVKATYSQSLPPVGGVDLWMGAIRSTGQTITVSRYTFYGFFAPVDNPPVVNTAKAGQAVPVKWRITDAKGIGVSDPGSFSGLTSNAATCSGWTGYQDPVPEVAAGGSGLQYQGNGNWQFNWKTPKEYAGQCRKMILTLDDGSKYPAYFRFK